MSIAKGTLTHRIPLLLSFLLLSIGCGGAVRSKNIHLLVQAEGEALARLEGNLEAGQTQMRSIVDILKDVRLGDQYGPGFLEQLDAWTLEVEKANFLTEVLRGSLTDTEVRRATLIKIAVIREAHENAKKSLAKTLEDAENSLIDSYSGIRGAVTNLRENLKTVERYTGSSNRKFVLSSADASIIGALASEIQGADEAISRAVKAISQATQVMSFLTRMSSSSNLEQALTLAGDLKELLDRIGSQTRANSEG